MTRQLPISPPTRLLAPLVLVAALLLGGAGSPAAGQDVGSGSKDGDELVVQSWALAPTGTDPAEPSSRPALTYTAEPGATIQDSVTLWNYGNVQLTFRVYATDAYNNAQGGFDLLPGDETPNDLGTWVSLPLPNVTVPAFSKVDLPIVVTVPAGARPGDHAGAILASNEAYGTGPDGRQVSLDRRTGTRIYLRVGGELSPQLTITKASSVYHGSLDPTDGALEVTYTIRNVGNVRLGAEQHVQVESIFGRKLDEATPERIDELLPGNEVTIHQRFTGVPATVRTGADIDVTPIAAGGGAAGKTSSAPAKPVSRSASTWAIPWILLVVAVLLVLTYRAVRWLQRRAVERSAAAIA